MKHTTPDDGENALAKQDYDRALMYFASAAVRDPASQEAQLGLVRALIGEDRVEGAQQQAVKALSASPQSAIAEIAVSEAAFRAADFVAVRLHSLAAFRDDPCEGRVYALFASAYALHAEFASAAKALATAHAFRPDDELIRRDWIGSLPLRQREEELSKYLAGATSLSNRDHQELVDVEDHLKAHKPGECKIISKTDTANIPFKPIMGYSQRPISFGLQVALNSKKSTMQIDTGAGGILLSPEVAKRLKLTPEYRLHYSGIGDEGEAKSYLTHVEHIQIGEIELSNCMVQVMETRSKVLAEDVDGLIGLNVFSQWLATLDYPHQRLILAPLPSLPQGRAASGPNASSSEQVQDDSTPDAPVDAIVPPGMNDWLRMMRVGHDILLPSSLNGGMVHYLIVDTGADTTFLSTAFAKQAGKVTEDISVRFSGLSGKVKKTIAWMTLFSGSGESTYPKVPSMRSTSPIFLIVRALRSRALWVCQLFPVWRLRSTIAITSSI